jgi:hypothetical protein
VSSKARPYAAAARQLRDDGGIVTDVLIMLISLGYSGSYPVVFRSFGFAVATVLIRLALMAPPYVNALLGLASALSS